MNPYDEQLARWATQLLQGRCLESIGVPYSIDVVKKWHDGEMDDNGWLLWDVDKIRLAGPEDEGIEGEQLFVTWRGVATYD